jgi:hypothetical protein
MQRFDAVGRWLRDDFLPGLIIVLGGVLIRCIRWTESRCKQRLDARMAAAIKRSDVASESLKRSRAVRQAGQDSPEESGARRPIVVVSVPLPRHAQQCHVGPAETGSRA